MLSQEDILRVFLPGWIFDYFELVELKTSVETVDAYLDEKKVIPPELLNKQVISHGFTEYSKVQDFPIQGKAVYLYFRRRKWLDSSSGEIHSRRFDLAFDGTRLTRSFVAFLKETNRE